ncbi:FtsH protease activity modulator HflK [Magnetospirillum gryphiswaldense]|uniref:Protein HflK n=2 Tax=Magnetospirillum gryphiswaldense TaxID=55518 RepID=V6F300_MAGGM|nr:FtsH protease activity modulator HflK [Magnetospirillum gryphiswaldense]AVM73286.1 Modulator of FtsH protease HflK [Magnetospirillum gryphiswaldense MSR-1]AVM77189.1 Modulator of FtsH protease HflK [Magnetospirillum gryphiswaldense]CAM75932.1 Band 7 protein [Magnetospirillum gryphiswaldense MSR-1]CDK98676.1 putative modulator for HflB protease specific for phage lambda cII repressor [Magnetospirillum gryphiswaldense MSR-1 v2]
MPWNSGGNGGGPWGGGGGSGGNGGGGNSGGPWGRGPGNGGGNNNGPDIEDLIRRSQDKLRRAMPGGAGLGNLGGKGLLLLVALGVAGWAATGIYRVQPDQQGVVLRFGQWVDTTEPGLRYHLPYPMESVLLPQVTKINQLQLGFRAVGDSRFERNSGRDVPEESRMLTGDENIVEADFTVFWQIKDAGKYLFNIRDPEGTVKVAAESAMRDMIGRNPIQAALSDKRQPIADAAKVELQRLLDSYDAGILITQVQLQKVEPPAAVIDAFNDVQRARADQERARNESEAYRNDIIPRARGEAEKMVQDAEAYKEQVLNQAQGQTKRFMALFDAWKQSPEVTERRLYLETMEDVMKGSHKIIIDQSKNGQGVVPYLPLNDLKKGAAQ